MESISQGSTTPFRRDNCGDSGLQGLRNTIYYWTGHGRKRVQMNGGSILIESSLSTFH